jgi:hypothetical protein
MKTPLSERLAKPTTWEMDGGWINHEIHIAPWVIEEVKTLEALNEEMFVIVKSLVVNRSLIGDSHFEGVRERLIDMAETIVNKVEGERND